MITSNGCCLCCGRMVECIKLVANYSFIFTIIQNRFFNYWQLNFVFLTFIIFLLNFFLLTIKEGNFDLKRNSQNQMMEKFNSKINFKNKKYPYFISWIISTFVGPIISFFKNNSFSIGIAILAFIFSFKIGEFFRICNIL